MPETTQAKIDTMLSHLLALIWEQGQVLRQHGPAGGKAMVFHAQAIHELTKAVKELGYALEFFNATAAPDDDPPQPQTEPAEWDQENAPTEETASEEADQ